MAIWLKREMWTLRAVWLLARPFFVWLGGGYLEWCSCLSLSLYFKFALHYSPHLWPFSSVPVHEVLSSWFSPFFSLHPSIFFLPSFPHLTPVLSFPSKRLARIFSSVVTFKTECHHGLPASLLLSCPHPLLTCLSLWPPAYSLSRLLSSCSECLLDPKLRLAARLAASSPISSVCACGLRAFLLVRSKRDCPSSTQLTDIYANLLVDAQPPCSAVLCCVSFMSPVPSHRPLNLSAARGKTNGRSWKHRTGETGHDCGGV